ncbi:MAG: pdxH [Holophagaceae bacterium]|nr:pdxH [Holophagaceae bacterium]
MIHDPSPLPEDPLTLLQDWLKAAEQAESRDPNAMALATVSPEGYPSLRMVLLKGLDARGCVFYTHLGSRKGRELAALPRAALCFHWKSLDRQVRLEGSVEAVSPEEADAYFASRPRESQLGAWASRQSEPMTRPQELDDRLREVALRFEGSSVPRPSGWSGFRLVPERIEFWEARPSRLHWRLLYQRGALGIWTQFQLFP